MSQQIEPAKQPNPSATPPAEMTQTLPGVTDPGKTDASDQGSGASPLSPEEQMALYEKALKEDDWGHQPC